MLRFGYALSCAPDRHARALQELIDAGYDQVYVHQVGAEQERFLEFYAQEVLPRLRQEAHV